MFKVGGVIAIPVVIDRSLIDAFWHSLVWRAKTFHAPRLEATVHAQMPEALAYVTLGRLAVAVRFYHNRHIKKVGIIKNDFSMAILLKVI